MKKSDGCRCAGRGFEFCDCPERQVSTAKTASQRQAERKARELAAGRVLWKRWVHPDDVPALAELADKLAKRRERGKKRG